MNAWLEPGVVLAGKFRVERVLGRGGMGVVVAARHLQLDELVAIKFLSPEPVVNQDLVARFEREARAAVKIKNEHVCRVIDVGTLEAGAPYMVMEYLNGRDLLDVLQGRGFLPLDEAIDYVLQASEAIAEAHALGIVHRDLKPANLFLIQRPDGSACIKVLDFGISKLTGASGARGHGMTATSTLMGSPLYMSPEQLTSARDVDATADVWSLGVILFELLTGTLPFLGETLPQVCANVLTSAPASLSSVRADLPAGVESIVNACLEKDRAARIPSVLELARRLSEFAPRRSRTSLERISGVAQGAGHSVSAMALPPSSDATGAPDSGTLAEFGRTWLGRSSNWFWAGGAAVLALLGISAYLMLRKAPVSSADVVAASSRSVASVSSAAPLIVSAQGVAVAATPPVESVAALPAQPETLPQPLPSARASNKHGGSTVGEPRVRPPKQATQTSGSTSAEDAANWGGRL